jgi:hypothetical protein
VIFDAQRRWRLLVIGAGLVLCADARRASGHDPFEVTTAAIVGAESLTLVATMTRSSAAQVSGLDAGARAFSADRFGLYEPELRAAAGHLYNVRSNGAELEPLAAHVALNAEDEIEFRVTYPRPLPGTLRLEASCLGLLSAGHGNAVRLARAQPDAVIALEFLNASDPVLDAWLPLEEPKAAAAPAAPSAPPSKRGFIVLGFRHILEGYDHLLFLAGLLLSCRGLASMLGLISCFTLAHSLTLALAVLGRVPGAISAWVEPLILLSIIFVGVENVWSRGQPKSRHLLSFGFGLIHGLGFASALTKLGVGAAGTQLIAPLLSFNLGVELGQMLIAAIALPLLLRLHEAARGPAIVRALSVAITSVGAYWLIAGLA